MSYSQRLLFVGVFVWLLYAFPATADGSDDPEVGIPDGARQEQRHAVADKPATSVDQIQAVVDEDSKSIQIDGESPSGEFSRYQGLEEIVIERGSCQSSHADKGAPRINMPSNVDGIWLESGGCPGDDPDC